jgi:hypothetical protein
MRLLAAAANPRLPNADESTPLIVATAGHPLPAKIPAPAGSAEAVKVALESTTSAPNETTAPPRTAR